MASALPDSTLLVPENEDLRAQLASLLASLAEANAQLQTAVAEREAAAAALEAAHRQLHDLSARLMNIQEAERARLACELHDDFSQRLALLAVNLHLLREAMPHDASAQRESVNDLCREVHALANDMRRTSHQLHPTRLGQLGLVSAMRGLSDDVAAAHGLAVRFEARNVSRDVPASVALCFYRVAQEALQNVARHSGVREAIVDLEQFDRELRLIVADAGCGFDTAARRSPSLGLASISERVRAIGGCFEIHSEVGRGTRVEVHAPLSSTS
jgi:signal transduction histidine kinase